MIQNKPVIGILPTYNLTNEKNDPYQDRASFVRMYVEKIKQSGGIPIGLLDQDISLYKEVCDGYLWPGGSKIWHEFHLVFEDVLKNKKPLLGVCLGAQAIATFFNVLEEKQENETYQETYRKGKEQNPYLKKTLHPELHSHSITKDIASIENARHKIKIEKNSLLFDIYKKEEMDVVSLHGIVIARTPKNLKVSATSEDGVTEAVEYQEDGNRILGVQFHPEIEEDSSIFEWLIEEAKQNK